MKVQPILIGFALIGLALAGCPATRQVRDVQGTHAVLVSDPSILKPGAAHQPSLYYVNPSTDWRSYTQMMIDPVLLWRGKDSSIQVSQQDAQHIANYFHRLLISTLEQDYKVVPTPEPHTLRLTVAITDLAKTDVVLNVVSTLIPQLRAATSLEGLVAGKPLFTGEVGMAFRVTDAMSGQLLSAGVSERAGGKHLDDSWKKWEDVDDSIKYWSAQFRYDFCQDRGAQGCIVPQAKKTF